MKALRLLIALPLLCNSSVLAEETKSSFDAYISKNKRQYYDLEEQKNESSSDMLRDSWISPVTLNYSYGVSKAYGTKSTTQRASIAIDQPIFQSGGIYFGIKYAQASRLYTHYSIEAAKRKMIKDAISLLMQIRQSDIRIEKQKLLIKNAQINLAQKKESYLSGQLDSGFLNNAIIEKNIVQQALFDIEANKERLISKLRVISDVDYEKAVLPKLKIVREEDFLAKNIVYEQSKSMRKKSRYNKNTVIAKYLPKISIYAGYNWDQTENFVIGGNALAATRETDYINYGLKASMPISINTLDDIETARVEYMESKILEIDKKREIRALYEQVIQNIDNLQKKKELSIQNSELYNKLLLETQELFRAGYKTKYDVSMLENSLAVQKKDIRIYELDKQIELLTLYEMYSNDI